jgi:hypothetical protein
MSSKASKMSKIINLSSSIKEQKLETHQSSKKSSHTAIEIHEFSDKSKTETSSIMSFWGHQT